MLRAYESPDGSVKNATGPLPGPLLQTNGLMKSLQEMLRMACGFSVTQSQAYTLHSPRHFLPGVAPARGEPGTCRCEIGRWSHSVAQLPSLRPEVNMIRRHRTQAATLPEPRYRAPAGNSDSTDAGAENILRKMWAGKSPNFWRSEKFDCLCQNKRPT